MGKREEGAVTEVEALGCPDTSGSRGRGLISIVPVSRSARCTETADDLDALLHLASTAWRLRAISASLMWIVVIPSAMALPPPPPPPRLPRRLKRGAIRDGAPALPGNGNLNGHTAALTPS